MVGDAVRDCGGADVFTFFPGSSRMVGVCVGVGVSLGEGDPAGVFAGAHPFCNFRPGTEPFLDIGTPISSGACSFLIITESCRFAIRGEGTTPLPGLFLGWSGTTLGRLGRVAPTLETGPSGLFLEPGILQKKDQVRNFPYSGQAAQRKARAAPELAGEEDGRPQGPRGLLEPPFDPLHDKNLRDAQDTCSEGSPSRSKQAKEPRNPSPVPIHSM